MTFDFSNSPVYVRDDIPKAFSEVWQTIAAPGNWWRGADRVAWLPLIFLKWKRIFTVV